MTNTAERTLIEFLLARVAEDEATARDPQRATRLPLSVCLAHRAIARDFRRLDEDESRTWDNTAQGEWNALERAATTLAALYADHIDYRDEWRA